MIEKSLLSKGQFVVALITLLIAFYGVYLARTALDIASQQLKDHGSWLRVRVVDFKYIRPGENKDCSGHRFKEPDTVGCFYVEIANRLADEAKNIRIDHRVPPEDWIAVWKLKESISEPGNVYSLKGSHTTQIILVRPIAADPPNYYCQKGNDLNLFVSLNWQDSKSLDYELMKQFKGDCIHTRTAERLFKWTPLT